MSLNSAIEATNSTMQVVKKLMELFPDYKQRIEKDFNEIEKEFNIYKSKPREVRHSWYLLNLKSELDLHLYKFLEGNND